jgi:signal transduction histidine kinase/CheY-like chemotaxis protein/ABC-type amino acid transport substrate-binding protein
MLKMGNSLFEGIIACFLCIQISAIFSSNCQAGETVRIGYEDEFPPYAFTNESGLPDGFGVDLIQAVTKTMGLSPTFIKGDWDPLWNLLILGELDILPNVADLPSRRPLVDFSLHHTETFDAFFVQAGKSAPASLEEAEGKEIVVMRSDAAAHVLEERHFPCSIIYVETITEGFRLIASGRHDAFLLSKIIGKLTLQKSGIENIDVGPAISDYKRTFAFAVPKGHPQLVEKLNQGLLFIKASGEYERIYQKWLTVDTPWEEVTKYWYPALVGLGLTVLSLSILILLMQILIRKKTRQLHEKNEMLRLAGEQLEDRVKERTQELTKVNHELYTEIIERQRIEQALVKERVNLQKIFDLVSIGMLLIDDRGVVVKANDVARKWMGKSRPTGDQLKPGDFLGCIHAFQSPYGCGKAPRCRTCDIRQAYTASLLESQPLYDVETRADLLIDGKETQLWFELRSDPVMIDGERFVIIAIKDITTRKKADEERELAIKFLHLISESKNLQELLSDARRFFIEQLGCDESVINLTAGPAVSYFWTNELEKQHAEVINRHFGQDLISASDGMSGSAAVIPLNMAERRIGLVMLRSNRTEAFSAMHIGLLERFAEFMAASVAKFQAQSALEISVRRFELLAQTAGKLLKTSQPEMVIDSLCSAVMEQLDCDIFFNYLVDDTQNRIELNAYAGISSQEAQKIKYLDSGVAVCGQVACSGQRIIVENIQAVADDPRTELVKSYGVRAYACHPLLGPGKKVIGTLSFGTSGRDTFAEDDLTLMKAVTDQVAVALNRMHGQKELAKAKLAAEKANQAKSLFLANMSHEIRTPLGAIMGFAEFLAEDGLSKEERQNFSSIVARNGHQLSSLINDILDLSKVESGSLTVNHDKVRLERLLKDIHNVMSIKAEEKAVTFEIIRQELPEFLVSDGVRMQQILTNLIGNALKFTATGGRVTLAVEADHMSGTIRFAVTDTGIGIAAENHGKVFEPFTQAEADTTKKFGGTGLGLTLSRSLARILGGDLILQRSKLGEGSTFVFSLPLIQSAAVALGASLASSQHKNAQVQQKPQLEGFRILLAEDTDINALLVQKLLKPYGANVDVVTNGRDAVQQALSGRYGAILMDIRMPVMDGLTATRELRLRGYRLPIIALTANALKEDQDASLAAGCNAHLSKPINRNELIQALQSAASSVASSGCGCMNGTTGLATSTLPLSWTITSRKQPIFQ